jgi:hypothetical protein
MLDVPNPYLSQGGPAAGGDLPEGCRRFPEPASVPELDDPNDMFGIPLGGGVLLGPRVDMLGPSEIPETINRLTHPRRDPTSLRYLSTSLGIRVEF